MFRVRELAQARDITQEELSRRSGVTISTVRRVWQNNRAGDPRSGNLIAIAKVLGVAVEELYSTETADLSNAQPDAVPVNKMSLAATVA
jgi:transcriptional regulator with XRE-family HTH domain